MAIIFAKICSYALCPLTTYAELPQRGESKISYNILKNRVPTRSVFSLSP